MTVTEEQLNGERATAVAEPGNGAEPEISVNEPYRALVRIEGVADLLFHRWDCESIEAKANARKGSTQKKTDDVESYVWRLDPTDKKSNIGLPGEYLRQSIVNAAKFRQDPRSPRKSAMDLYKAGIVSLTLVADLGAATWDYLDRRRVTVQRAGVTRQRPAFLTGWKAEFVLQVGLPEYISPQELNEVIAMAGRVVGVGDFRPTYGRFNVTHFEVLQS